MSTRHILKDNYFCRASLTLGPLYSSFPLGSLYPSLPLDPLYSSYSLGPHYSSFSFNYFPLVLLFWSNLVQFFQQAFKQIKQFSLFHLEQKKSNS